MALIRCPRINIEFLDPYGLPLKADNFLTENLNKISPGQLNATTKDFETIPRKNFDPVGLKTLCPNVE